MDHEVSRRTESVCNALVATYPRVAVLVMDTDEFPAHSYAATTPANGLPFAIMAISSTMGSAAEWDRYVTDDIGSGFHPIGFNDRGGVEGVITHEFGHLLAFSAGIPPRGPQPAQLVARWMGEAMPDSVSAYAVESPHETLAEAFAEYVCARHPRPISIKIAEKLIETYRRNRFTIAPWRV